MSQLTFNKLDVYKACRKLRKDVSTLTKTHFPEHEKYRLTDQIIRSSRSVTANIAEGSGRFYYKENIQFCRKSRGSLYETLEHFITAFDENYISSEMLVEVKASIDACGRLLNGYIKYLKKAKPPKEESDNPATNNQ